MLTEDLVISLKDRASKRCEIQIKDEQSTYIGKLSLLQEGDEENLFIVNSLTNWRRRFMKFFLSQFNASPHRTQQWLRNVVFPASDRLLFLIIDNTDKVIGNFGLANISLKSCELDNLIRGEKGGHPRLIYYAECSLLSWLFERQGMNYVNLHVFSNNIPTLKLHASVGFKEVSRCKLLKNQRADGEVTYVESDHIGDGDISSLEYIEMGISSIDFMSRKISGEFDE